MKDKRRKYDLSYFIKDGGKSKDTSPSVNASEMNENERKRRNDELIQELQEIEDGEREVRILDVNNGPENPNEEEKPPDENNNCCDSGINNFVFLNILLNK